MAYVRGNLQGQQAIRCTGQDHAAIHRLWTRPLGGGEDTLMRMPRIKTWTYSTQYDSRENNEDEDNDDWIGIHQATSDFLLSATHIIDAIAKILLHLHDNNDSKDMANARGVVVGGQWLLQWGMEDNDVWDKEEDAPS